MVKAIRPVSEKKPVHFTWLDSGERSHRKPKTATRGNEVRLDEKEYLWLEKGMRSLGLFAKLNLRNLATLLPYMRLFSFPKGSVVCREGDPGDSFFLIYRGGVDVTKSTGIFSGSPIRLARLQSGDFFGELALLLNQPRSATCVATKESRIFVLKYDDFRRILEKHPVVLRKVRKVGEQRMRQLTKAWAH
ncbi:MAG: cyclic nucleotide-binding domain-containing protein [Elusimicrobiota bacterium]